MTSSIVTVNSVNTAVVGSYTVTYNVHDSNGNAAVQVTRTVNVVDTTAPVITLSGSTPVTIQVGSVYIDAGASATDNYDPKCYGDGVLVLLTQLLLGQYVITYDAVDAHGNHAASGYKNC